MNIIDETRMNTQLAFGMEKNQLQLQMKFSVGKWRFVYIKIRIDANKVRPFQYSSTVWLLLDNIWII